MDLLEDLYWFIGEFLLIYLKILINLFKNFYEFIWGILFIYLRIMLFY